MRRHGDRECEKAAGQDSAADESTWCEEAHTDREFQDRCRTRPLVQQREGQSESSALRRTQTATSGRAGTRLTIRNVRRVDKNVTVYCADSGRPTTGNRCGQSKSARIILQASPSPRLPDTGALLAIRRLPCRTSVSTSRRLEFSFLPRPVAAGPHRARVRHRPARVPARPLIAGPSQAAWLTRSRINLFPERR